MGFKQALQQHNDSLQHQDESASVSSIGSAKKLADITTKITPMVDAVLDRFLADASSEDFYAEKSLLADETRCVWAFSFVPAKNEAPSESHQPWKANQVSAFIRLSSSGEVHLDWHHYRVDALTSEERRQTVLASHVTEQLLDRWLSGFVARMLDLRVREKSTHLTPVRA